MAKTARTRAPRLCDLCAQASAVLYRIKQNSSTTWQFACKACQTNAKSNWPEYSYGGTWKQQKRH